MANTGGITQRLLDMSGYQSQSYVHVEQEVVGIYEGSGYFSEIDVAAPAIPPFIWWDICPWDGL